MALLMNTLGGPSENMGHFDDSAIERHPKIRATAFQADSLRFAAEGASALHWPRVTLFAKSSLDYPNGPTLERVHQNSVGATLTWSLFEFGRIHYDAAEKRSLADAAEGRKRQLEIDLARDWRKTLDQIAALNDQRETHRLSIEQSEKLVDLIYQSYRAGHSSFLEVQSSNLAALNAKIAGRRNEIQILIQTADERCPGDQSLGRARTLQLLRRAGDGECGTPELPQSAVRYRQVHALRSRECLHPES